MAETQAAMCYPAEEQYDRWKSHADELDMSVSEFIQSMVEAGRRKFDVDVSPDETARELRAARNELRAELEAAREKIDRLERTRDMERAELREFLDENPDATFKDAVDHVMGTVPGRVREHIETMDVELESPEEHPGETAVYGWVEGEEWDETAEFDGEDIEDW